MSIDHVVAGWWSVRIVIGELILEWAGPHWCGHGRPKIQTVHGNYGPPLFLRAHLVHRIRNDKRRELDKDRIKYKHDKLLSYHVFGAHQKTN